MLTSAGFGWDLICRHFRRFRLALERRAELVARAHFLDNAIDLAAEPQAKETTTVSDTIATQFDAIGLKRNPAQMSLTAASGQTTLTELFALLGKLCADELNRMGLQTKFSTASSRELAQVVSRQPLVVSAKGKHRYFVTVVPYEIYGPRQTHGMFCC